MHDVHFEYYRPVRIQRPVIYFNVFPTSFLYPFGLVQQSAPKRAAPSYRVPFAFRSSALCSLYFLQIRNLIPIKSKHAGTTERDENRASSRSLLKFQEAEVDVLDTKQCGGSFVFSRPSSSLLDYPQKIRYRECTLLYIMSLEYRVCRPFPKNGVYIVGIGTLEEVRRTSFLYVMAEPEHVAFS